MLGRAYDGQDCSLAAALEVIGERWTLLIVRDAFLGVQRFSDFQAHLDVPRGVLSDRLSGLVADGILLRRPDPRHAGRHRYELTAVGRDLWPAINALLAWGERHRKPNSRTLRHLACDGPLDDCGHCPECGVTPAPEQIVAEPRDGGERDRSDPVARALRAPHRLLEPLETR